MNIQDVRLILCPLNFIGYDNISHTGLAVSAQNTAKYMRVQGVNAQVKPVRNAAEIEALILNLNPTHVVINALWLPTRDLTNLVFKYVYVSFVVLCHSNIAFLQAEPKGIILLKDAADLELSAVGNFNVATNSRAGASSLQDAWEAPCAYLPNLYYLDNTVRTYRRKWSGGTLRIGTFGAIRALKNPTGAAFAALSIATNLATDLEYHINTGRNDGGQSANLIKGIQAIFAGLPNATLVQDPWDAWSGFRKLVRHMHLLLQPSFTESFNMVTADGVAECIPSVVSDVIEWAPDWWKVSPDNVPAIARAGRALLSDEHTGADGVAALTQHNESGFGSWVNYLTNRQV